MPTWKKETLTIKANYDSFNVIDHNTQIFQNDVVCHIMTRKTDTINLKSRYF